MFTLVVPGSITVGVPYLLLSSGMAASSYEIGGFRVTGAVPIALGTAIYISSAWNFASTGKGTPAIYDPPKRLVWTGLYRLVRNPIYVGVALVLVGEAIAFESVTLLAYAIIVWLVFHLFVIAWEEPYLKHKFGATGGLL